MPIKQSLITNDAAARLQFTLAGQGLAVLPNYDAQEHIASGKLIEVMKEFSLPTLELYAVFPQGATQAKAVSLKLEMLKQNPPHQVAELTV